MCGRYTLRTNIVDLFDVESQFDFIPRFNIAPTQMNPVIRQNRGFREMSLMRWGFIPFWAKDSKIGYRMINARSEEIAKSYRPSLKNQRCLVLADGWYEWKNKVPYHFRKVDNQPFAFAGLWSTWKDMETFTILTAESAGVASGYHARMPVILRDEDCGVWTDPNTNGFDLIETIVENRDCEVEVVAANPCVGNVKNETPDCLN